MPLISQIAEAGQEFRYVIPDDVIGFQVRVLAGINEGFSSPRVSSLPSWLTYDPATRTLSGTPSEQDAGKLQLGFLTVENSFRYQDYRPFNLAIRGTDLTDTIFVRSSNGIQPAVATFSNGDFVIIWSRRSGAVYGSNGVVDSGEKIVGQRYNSLGDPTGDEFVVNETFPKHPDADPAIAVLQDGGFVVTWTSGFPRFNDTTTPDGSSAGVFGQRYDANGNKVGSDFQVNTISSDDQYDSSIAALSNGGFIVAWTSVNASSNTRQVSIQRYDANAIKVGGEIGIPNTYDTPSITALGNGGFAVSGDQSLQFYNSDGTRVGNGIFPSSMTENPVLGAGFRSVSALNDGGLVILGQAGSSLVAQRYTANGVRNGNAVIVPGGTPASVEGLSNGGFIVVSHKTLNNTQAQRFDANGNPVGVAFDIRDPASSGFGGRENSEFIQENSNIAALSNGGFLVTWAERRALVNTTFDIRARIFEPINSSTNLSPVVVNAIADQTATIGTAFSFAVPTNSFSDPDTRDTLTYTATLADAANSALPSWLTFDAATKTFSGTPPTGASTATPLSVRVTASDNENLSVSDDFNITLSNPVANRAPIVANAIADTTATIGTAFSFVVPANAFSDPNTGDTLTYTATLADSSNSPLPSWLTFNAATKTFAGTPPTGTGNLNMRVKATDNGGLSVTDDFAVTISASGGSTNQLTPYVNTNNQPLLIEYPIDVNGSIYGLGPLSSNNVHKVILKLDPVTGNVSEPIKDATGSIITSSQSPPNWVNVNGTLVFLGVSSLDRSRGGLWKVDARGKAVLFESTNNSNASGDRPIQFQNLTNVDGILYFSGQRAAFDRVTYTVQHYGYEIYKLDPATGTTTFIEVEPGTGSSNPTNFTNINGTLYFTATTASSGTELWKLDASGNPQKLEIIAGTGSSNPANFTKFNNNLYFSVLSGSTGAGLYKIDTTTGNPIKIVDANVYETVIVNGEMYFRTGDFGRDIKKIDASDNITQVSLGTLRADGPLTSVNNTLYFRTYTVNGTALSKLDASGNIVVFDNVPGTGSGGGVDHLTKVGNDLYFVAQETSASDLKIWKIDSATGQPVEIGTSPQTNYIRQTIGLESNSVPVFPGSDGFLYKIGTGTTPTTNNPPVVANAIADQTATLGTAFSFVVPANSFSDPDAGNTLTYSAALANGNALPSWLTFDANTRTFSGTPPTGISTTTPLFVRVTAKDNGNLSVSDDFNITLNNPTSTNQAPVVANAIANQTATLGSAFSFVVPANAFSDPENDTLTYSAALASGAALPNWLSFNASTRTFNGTPPTGTSTTPLSVRVTARDNGNLSVSDDFSLTLSDPSPTNTSSVPGLSLASNLFQTDATFKGFGVTPISQKNTQKVSEIALFSVDDLAGTIGGIAPGQPGYLAAALQNAKTIFSTLGDAFFSTETRELALDPNKIYQVIEIVDGSLLEAQQQLAGGINPNNLLFSLPDSMGNSPIKITSSATGYNVAINNDELRLSIDRLTGQAVVTPIGAKSQSSAAGRTIDLSDYIGQTLKADILTNGSAAYNNQIGFYAVEDASGTIKLADGSTLNPGDADYAAEAIKLALTNALQADKNTTTQQNIIGGKIYAPVVVTQGTLDDFLSQNPSNGGGAQDIHAYFNYLGANPDKVDHFRLLGNNTFGVEDLYGGGDRDFNDLVIKMNLQI
jgi:ELWxxDGT repeat protein